MPFDRWSREREEQARQSTFASRQAERKRVEVVLWVLGGVLLGLALIVVIILLYILVLSGPVLATSDIRSEKTGNVPRTSRKHNPLVLAPGALLKKEGLISSEISCFAASSGSKAKS